MIRFEEHLPPRKAPSAHVLRFLESGLTRAEWNLCRAPRSGHSSPKPDGGQFYRTYSNVGQQIGERREVVEVKDHRGRPGLAVETVVFRTPLPYRFDLPHPVGLDARPYLTVPPTRPGPLFRLHDFLAQL